MTKKYYQLKIHLPHLSKPHLIKISELSLKIYLSRMDNAWNNILGLAFLST